MEMIIDAKFSYVSWDDITHIFHSVDDYFTTLMKRIEELFSKPQQVILFYFEIKAKNGKFSFYGDAKVKNEGVQITVSKKFLPPPSYDDGET